MISIAGLGVIVEGATGAYAYTLARLRTWASPHAEDEGSEPEEQDDNNE